MLEGCCFLVDLGGQGGVVPPLVPRFFYFYFFYLYIIYYMIYYFYITIFFIFYFFIFNLVVLPAYPGAYAHERERRENQGESISSLTYCGAAHGREKAKKRERERKSGHLPKRKGVECAYEQVGYMVDNHLSNTAHFPKHLYPCTPPALPDLALSRHLYTGQTNTLACACAYSIIEECS